MCSGWEPNHLMRLGSCQTSPVDKLSSSCATLALHTSECSVHLLSRSFVQNCRHARQGGRLCNTDFRKLCAFVCVCECASDHNGSFYAVNCTPNARAIATSDRVLGRSQAERIALGCCIIRTTHLSQDASQIPSSRQRSRHSKLEPGYKPFPYLRTFRCRLSWVALVISTACVRSLLDAHNSQVHQP